MTAANLLVPAAQYLRMSTEHQQYSLENQSNAIRVYAESHGFDVVLTYSDAAKSGVVLKHRKGLKQLLGDVVAGEVPYRVILVYDVSRWGRFQDADESAHYEFVCKDAGVPVHYCAEVFANDGTLPNTILKSLKRAMAGEYSRELSARVVRAKRLMTEKGFRVGGVAGYGFRRMLLSADGKPRRILEPGEQVENARVVLVHGPLREVAVVREIFRVAIAGMGASEIARRLNRRHIKRPDQQEWTITQVRGILMNPKYMGWAVSGRRSALLGRPSVAQPRDSWAVKVGAFDAIVDGETFAAADAARRARTRHESDAVLLGNLRAVLLRVKRLSRDIIDGARECASANTYRTRFGSLRRSYDLIGYHPIDHLNDPKCRRAITRVRRKREQLLNKLLRDIRGAFRGELTATRRGLGRPVLTFRDGLRVTIAYCATSNTPIGNPRWVIPPLFAKASPLVLLCFLNASDQGFRDCYLIPGVDLPHPIKIKPNDRRFRDPAKRLGSISSLRRLAERTRGV